MPPVDQSAPPPSAPIPPPLPQTAGAVRWRFHGIVQSTGRAGIDSEHAAVAESEHARKSGWSGEAPAAETDCVASGRPGAAGPSEFTRILGRVSPPAARPAPPKPPGATPAPAPAPAALTKTVKSYLPLIHRAQRDRGARDHRDRVLRDAKIAAASAAVSTLLSALATQLFGRMMTSSNCGFTNSAGT